MNVAVCYFTYLAISIGITVWVARTLHQNGRVFLLDAFHGDAGLADSVNHLLVVGFYLINLGYIALRALDHKPHADVAGEVIELGKAKIGVVMLILWRNALFQHLRGCEGERPLWHTATSANGYDKSRTQKVRGNRARILEAALAVFRGARL